MKILKRLLLLAAGLLLLAIVFLAVCYALLRSVPGYYRTYTWDGERRSIENQRVVDKLLHVQNLAAKSQAQQRQTQLGVAQTNPVLAPVTVNLTEEQVNAFLLHNAELEGIEQDYRQYVADPVVLLREGQMIVAGRVEDFGGIVASVHLKAGLDQGGQLRMDLVKTMGGRLMLPRALVTTQLDRFRSVLSRRLPRWGREATMDSTGRANASAVSAAMTRMLIGALDQTPADALVFVPLGQGGKWVPLRLTELRIGEKSLTFTVEPMTAGQREVLLGHIRSDGVVGGRGGR